MCMCTCVCACARMCVCCISWVKSRGQLSKELRLPFNHLGPRHPTQIKRLSCRCLYPWATLLASNWFLVWFPVTTDLSVDTGGGVILLRGLALLSWRPLNQYLSFPSAALNKCHRFSPVKDTVHCFLLQNSKPNWEGESTRGSHAPSPCLFPSGRLELLCPVLRPLSQRSPELSVMITALPLRLLAVTSHRKICFCGYLFFWDTAWPCSWS